MGLSSKILPHNFNEIIDAAIAHLKGEEFTLYPDFPTGGSIDVSRYNDGERGGSVKIRAKIEKLDNKTLAITEIPYGKTTATLIESILKAFESGKIKIRKVDDNTAEHANILVHLLPGTSSDRTIDALYAFTDCEVSVSPNCCVISEEAPLHRRERCAAPQCGTHSRHPGPRAGDTARRGQGTVAFRLARTHLYRRAHLQRTREYEESENRQEAIDHIRRRFEPWLPKMIREITDDDIIRLFEIKMGRILKFNSRKCEEQIAAYLARIDELTDHLAHLTEYTIDWYEKLKAKYGAAFPRMTQIRNFDNIQAATVAEANEKLYINREEGLHRHIAQEGRVSLQLLQHRRCDNLLQGRPLQGGQGAGETVGGQGRDTRRRVQAKRRAHNL